MVQLNYRCRYVYADTPRNSAAPSKSSLPNGHLPNGNEKSEAVDGVVGDDVKEKISEAADVVLEKAAAVTEKVKQVGQKGKSKSAGSSEKVVPNGYAHAPHWPLVSAGLSSLVTESCPEHHWIID